MQRLIKGQSRRSVGDDEEYYGVSVFIAIGMYRVANKKS